MKDATKVLTIGGATQDIFIYYEDVETMLDEKKNHQAYILLEQGSKIDVTKLHYYSGGGATNSAVSFARLGFETSSFFKIGKDSQGQFILSDLKKENIILDSVVYSNTQTGISFVIPPPAGDRVILAFRGANKDLKENEIPYEQIKNSNQLYITSLTGESSKLIEPITDFAKKNKIPVACNPGMNQLKIEDKIFQKSLKNIDILNINNTEAQEFMNTLGKTLSFPVILREAPFDIAQDKLHAESKDKPKLIKFVSNFAKIVLNLGPSIVVVTNGAEGVYVANKENIYFHPSIKPKKFVNTLGAGDSFGSCFVASILHGKSIEQAMVDGTLNSSSVISHEGAKAGLLTLEELEKRAKDFGLSKIQKFDY